MISGSDVNADQFVMNLLQDLQERERFVMNDGSPFFVNQLAYSTKLDPLKDGQVTVRGQYGKLRDVETVDELKTITIIRRKTMAEKERRNKKQCQKLFILWMNMQKIHRC